MPVDWNTTKKLNIFKEIVKVTDRAFMPFYLCQKFRTLMTSKKNVYPQNHTTMTAIGPLSSVPRNSGSDSALLRLERNNQSLLSLEEKLRSYVCEPKTRRLYDRMESIKQSLQNLKNSNLEIIRALKDHSLFYEEAKDRILQQLETYKTLELKVLEYIGMAKLHC